MRAKGVVGLLLALSLLAGQANGFFPTKWMGSLASIFPKQRSISHVKMTNRAIEVVLEEMAKTQESITGYKVNYKGTPSHKLAKDVILTSNANTDLKNPTKHDPRYHFDAEKFVDTLEIMIGNRNRLIALLRKNEITTVDYITARQLTGTILHTLQDFYSHSNWIEMGNANPRDNIFSNDFFEKEVAGPDVCTCTNCRKTCINNIRPEINSKSLLTSGYFSSQKIDNIAVPKPKGKWKCSHGGLFDSTRFTKAKGGINKDGSLKLFSPHYYLHQKAADVATKATVNFFRDLRNEVNNDLAFGRYLGFEQTPSIGFVIDTTRSMGPFINNVRTKVLRIIDERAQNGKLPAIFMLVPFNDPGYGPVVVSKNVTEFRKWITELFPHDGGDEPEMFFSGLMLCLNAIEPHSEIFIFTDASAKDAFLVSQAVAIGVRKKCKVNVVHVRWSGNKRSLDNQGNFQRTRALTYPEYDEIAFSTGGLMLNPTSTEFQELMVVIGDLTKTQQVNLLNVRHVDTTTSKVLAFPVDNSVSDIVIFYTGTVSASPIITISDPSGTMNSVVAGNTTLLSTQISGSTFIIRLKEPKMCGVWKIQITSPGTSSLRIIGQSSLNFIYKFGVEDDVGPHPGIRVITNKPSTGVPLLVEVTITGEDTSSAVAEMLTLLSPDGRPLQIILLNDTSPGDYIGRIDSLPEEQFSVYVSGKDSRNDTFGRVFPTVSQVTTITLEIVSTMTYPKIAIGIPTYLNVSVTNSGDADTFTATVSVDPGFIVSILPSDRFNISRNSSVILTLKLETNSTVEIGTIGTFLLVVHGANSTSNFIDFQAQLLKYDDDSFPTCEIMAERKCPKKLQDTKCKSSTWNATIQFNDTGSGIKIIDAPGGMSNITVGKTLTKSYSGDCCNTVFSVNVTDMADNLRVCSYDMKASAGFTMFHIGIWQMVIFAFGLALSGITNVM